MERRCPTCEKVVIGRKNKVYCSNRCWEIKNKPKYNTIYEYRKRKPILVLNCPVCGLDLSSSKRSDVKTCGSKKCKYASTPLYREKAYNRFVLRKDEINTIRRSSYQRDPSNRKTRAHNYRALRLGARGSYTQEDWKEILNNQKGLCKMCGLKTRLTVDHIVPLSRNGSNFASNIQGLCLSCNCRKSNKLPSEIIIGG